MILSSVMLSVALLSAMMLSVVLLLVNLLSVVLQSVVLQSVVLLSVMTPLKIFWSKFSSEKKQQRLDNLTDGCFGSKGVNSGNGGPAQ